MNNDYYSSKQAFFSNSSKRLLSTDEAIKRTINEAQARGYAFAAQYKKEIEEECSQLSAALAEQATVDEYFGLLLIDHYTLLEQYHRVYGQPHIAEQYKKAVHQVSLQLQHITPAQPPLPNRTFLTYLLDSFKEELKELASIPFHLSKQRQLVSRTNINRVDWIFCRMLLNFGLPLASTAQLLNQSRVDNLIRLINKPNPVFLILSVLLFSLRLAMNIAMIIKHSWGWSAEEKTLPTNKRLAAELNKRSGELLNDAGWLPVNFFSNFIMGPQAANALLCMCLPGDGLLLLWLRKNARKEYLKKMEQYNLEIDYYKTVPGLSEAERTQHLRILTAQKKHLDIGWQALNAKFLFNATAAFLLMAGYSVSLMVAAFPMLVLACYALNVFAIAMYLSDSSYYQFKKASLSLQDHTNKEFIAARNEFIKTLATNTLLPGLLIGSMAISLQLTVVLTVCYIGHMLWSGYSKSKETPNVPRNPQYGRLFSREDRTERTEIMQTDPDNTLPVPQQTLLVH